MPYAPLPDTTVLYYEDTGPRDGVPVVLLHGATQEGSVWRSQIPTLELHGFRPIPMDLPGHGKSDRTDADPVYDIPRYSRSVQQAMRRVLDRPAIVVGHSMAAGVALNTVLDAPELVLGTVVVNGTSHSSGWSQQLLAQVRLDVMEWFEVHFRAICSRKSPPERIDAVAYGLGRCPPEIAWNDIQAFSNLDLRPRLGEIRSPVAFLHGAEDWAITVAMAEETKGLCSEAPTRLEVIDDIGHFPHQEDPERFGERFVDILDWVTAEAAGADSGAEPQRTNGRRKP
jgi:pimeloyl-ACP methyl ester carboxylesterase